MRASTGTACQSTDHEPSLGYFGFTRVPFGRNLAPSMLHQVRLCGWWVNW